MKNIKLLLLFISFFLVSHADQKQPNILLLHFWSTNWTGAEAHTLNRYKALLKNGCNATMLILPNTLMEEELKKLHLPYTTLTKRPLWQDIYDTCTQLKIDIVICNNPINLDATKKVAQKYPIKIISVKHMPISQAESRQHDSLKQVDGFIGVSPYIVHDLEMLNQKHGLNIKNITYIPPFFEENKFLSFVPTQSKESFFKINFNIELNRYPMVCMIANFYNNLAHKNHPLLFKAVQKLVYEKNRPVQVMLAGDGPQRQNLEMLAQELGIQNYIHFLGFTPQTPELLYHVDMHVLSSSQEAFGQVHVEAGLMGKPTIGATKTGAEAIIQDGITGFLFENNNLDDLVTKIEILIDNPELGTSMGKAAYSFVQEHFSNQAQYLKLKYLFDKIMKD